LRYCSRTLFPILGAKGTTMIRALQLLLLAVAGVRGEEPSRYLFVSSSSTAKVYYVRLPSRGPITGAGAPQHKVEILIDSGLKLPMGLAADQQRSRLLVADPGERKVFAYKLLFSGGKAVIDGSPEVAVQDVEARWVAVDGIGSVFVTDERNNLIMKVPAEKAFRKEPTATALYNGGTLSMVSAPGGIAVDNFHVYWSNKATGQQSGSVVKGFEAPATSNAEESVKKLATNAEKVYGVCLAKDNVFYTDFEKNVYGVKKGGSQQMTISDKFQEPRGCAWDGDGTVFIADRKANMVMAFAGNMQKMSAARVGKVVDQEGAFGVAVLSGAHSALCGVAYLVILATGWFQ